MEIGFGHPLVVFFLFQLILAQNPVDRDEVFLDSPVDLGRQARQLSSGERLERMQDSLPCRQRSAIGDRHGRTPGEVALAWTLRRPEVTGAIVGLRSPQQVDGVIGAAQFRLSDAEVAEIAKA